MLAEADAVVQSVSGEEMAAQLQGGDVVMVDIRDPREIEREGLIPGAFHAPRGMLEFWIDPKAPITNPLLPEAKTFVFYCASGWRSLLAARLAQKWGWTRAACAAASEWKTAGHPVATQVKRER